MASSSSSSSSSRQSMQASSSSGGSSGARGGGSVRSFSNSLGRRMNEPATMRGGRYMARDMSALPEVGERTIYVTDEGLIVSTIPYHGGLFFTTL